METRTLIRPLRPMREVHPIRNAIVFGVLALVLIACAVVWWDHRDAAQSIADAVANWER